MSLTVPFSGSSFLPTESKECMCFFFLSLLSLLFLLRVLFLSSVQSGWPLWIEGRSDSVEKVDWWLIVQPDSARPNWLGCDPVLALRPLIFFPFFIFALFFFPSLRILPPLRLHTLAQTHTACKYTCMFRLLTHFLFVLASPPPVHPPALRLLCCTKLIIVAIIHSLLFPFFLPLPTLFSLSLLLQDRFCPMSQFIRFHFTASIHSAWNTGHSQETLQQNDPNRQIQRHFWFCWI